MPKYIDIFIEFDLDFYGNQVYFVGATDSIHRPFLWVSKSNSLGRLKENRAFVRDYDKALKLVELISNGTLKEGVPLSLFNTRAVEK